MIIKDHCNHSNPHQLQIEASGQYLTISVLSVQPQEVHGEVPGEDQPPAVGVCAASGQPI